MFNIPEEMLKPEEPYTGELRDYFVSYTRIGDLNHDAVFGDTVINAPFPITGKTVRAIRQKLAEYNKREHPGFLERYSIIQFLSL